MFPTDNAGQSHSTQTKKLIKFMPCRLKDTVSEVNTGLSVVSSRDQSNRLTETFPVSIELAKIDLHKITEAFVAKENFSARVDALEPRSSLKGRLTIDESWFGASGIKHEPEDIRKLLRARLMIEDETVVGLFALLIVLPIVLFGLSELNPLRVSIRHHSNLSGAPRTEDGPKVIQDIKDIDTGKEAT